MKSFLITAFEPFGPFRGRLQGRNASLDLLKLLRPRLDGRFQTVLLPTGEEGLELLAFQLIRLRPVAVLCLGEARELGSSPIHIEPYAMDETGNRIHSSWAEILIGMQGQPTESHIGRHYCNRAYLTALRWSSSQGGTPVIFVHIAVAGSRWRQCHMIRKLLELACGTGFAGSAQCRRLSRSGLSQQRRGNRNQQILPPVLKMDM